MLALAVKATFLMDQNTVENIRRSCLMILTCLKLSWWSANTCRMVAWMAANTETSVIVLPTWIWIPEAWCDIMFRKKTLFKWEALLPDILIKKNQKVDIVAGSNVDVTNSYYYAVRIAFAGVRHVTGNDEDYLRKIPRVVVQKSALYKGPL